MNGAETASRADAREPMRVMRILTRPNLGGPTRQAIALWHAHRVLGLRTLLVTGGVDAAEALLSPADGGVPAIAWPQALAAGPAAEGWLQVPHLGRGVALLGDQRAQWALGRVIASFRPDVVHTHTSKAGWLGRRAAHAAHVPVVAHTFHGHVLQDYFGGVVSWWLRRLETRLAARTSVLFAVSPSCADELATAGIAPRDRFVVVPPAVATPPALDRAAAREQLSIAARQRRVACIGRLVPIKRVEHFVQAVAAVPGCHGDVFGEGPERAALLALAARVAPERIHLRSAHPQIARLLGAYDALVVPSVREGCPLVAVEAFAAGVPVVGYDVPGVRDVLAQWGCGLLVPAPAGPSGLAAALQRLADEPDLAGACAAQSRAGVGRFAPAAVAEALLNAYRSAQAGRPCYDARSPR